MAIRPQAHRASRRRRGCAGDRGATLVEFAIIAPLLFALLFGIIDFGINLSNQISVRQGVREGARQAVVAAPDADAPADIVALTRSRIGIDDSGVRVRAVAEPVGSTLAGQPGSNLTVCAFVPMRSLTGFYGVLLDGQHLSSKVTMRVEQELPWVQPTVTSVGDAPPAGESWASCEADDG